MFKDRLFRFNLVEKSESMFVVEVFFDPQHVVFKGHFPGRPIVPGVLLMQTVKECFESITGFSGMQIESGDLKFTNPVVPEFEEYITVEIAFSKLDNHNFKIKSIGYSGETKFFKINFELRKTAVISIT